MVDKEDAHGGPDRNISVYCEGNVKKLIEQDEVAIDHEYDR